MGSILILVASQYKMYERRDIIKQFNENWALEIFNEIFQPDFYLKFMRSNLDEDDIVGMCKTFYRWHAIVEDKFIDVQDPYLGGDEPSLGDIVLINVYTNFVYND